jgi:small subunit ribosomal protein S2
MTKLPDMVVLTSMQEKNPIKECAKKGIPCIALVDTNCNPFSVKNPIKYLVPGNDRSIQTASLFLAYCGDYCLLGLRDENLTLIKDKEQIKSSN